MTDINRREFRANRRCCAVAPAKRPKLIGVFADQLRYASCGYAGDELARNERAKSP